MCAGRLAYLLKADWGQSETSGSSGVPTAAWRSKYRSTSGTGSTTREETSSEKSDARDDRRGVGTLVDERPGKRVRRQNVVTNASSFGDIDYAAVGDPVPVDNPTVHEALNGPHVEDWRESIHNENMSLVKRECCSGSARKTEGAEVRICAEAKEDGRRPDEIQSQACSFGMWST